MFYSADGSGNNNIHATWGESGTDLLRISPAAYADGVSAPALAQDQSARAISNLINNQAYSIEPSRDIQTVDQNSLSDFGYVWGQFIDHDLDLTTTNSGESFPIPVAPVDPIGTQPFTRSTFDPNTGTGPGNPRQQVNSVTSYLDLSQVYGSRAAVADALRTHIGGLLKTSPGNMLPYNNTLYFTAAQLAALNMANDAQAVPSADLFATGDVRGNENLELTALQTLFVRNHNRLARELQSEHLDWTDEQLYQEARRLNIAEEQIVTYTEWIPAVLGPNALPAYSGYLPKVNASIATEFSTVAFRFGHSLLSNVINRQDNQGVDINIPGGAPISLAEDFFDPNLLNPNGVLDPLTGLTSSDIDPILKGDADGLSQAMDLMAINEVRNLLFGNGQFGGQDLIARDIQRARDHGIGSYNDLRAAYGLPRLTSFAQITGNAKVQQELQQAYGSVDDIDPFEGGLAEDHIPGSDVGPLFRAIMVDQFTRLRNGDRLFYLNQHFTPAELALLEQANTLAKIIEANTRITNLQNDVFLFQASISGTIYSGRDTTSGLGMTGITVELQDSSGDILAGTVTDSEGHYSFSQLSGPSTNPEIASGVSATGSYRIVPILPPGLVHTPPNPRIIIISCGGTAITEVDFWVVSWPVVNCAAISAIAGAPFNGVVASFTDADGDPLNHFTATLDWGDGTTAPGRIAANSSGGFIVSDNHTYATHGPFTLKVEVDDTDGSSGYGTYSLTATVTGQFASANQNATINFWAGSHGQSLLDSFNGGPTSTALATLLATSFPNLYGAGARANNLTGKTNAQVAALFLTFYAEARPKPDAQALALALNIYATTSSLGGTAGAALGFSVTSTGLGASFVSLGTNGAAFDAPNNVGVTAYDLLKEANAHAYEGVLYSRNSALLQEFLNVVIALNDTGMNS